MESTIKTIFNYLIARQTTFTVDCIEFKENVIKGTDKIRERKCMARAKVLAEIVKDC